MSEHRYGEAMPEGLLPARHECESDPIAWSECDYVNKCVYPPIFGTFHMAKIDIGTMAITGHVYPIAGGWSFGVQSVRVVEATEFHTPLHDGNTVTLADALSAAEKSMRENAMRR